MHEGHQSIMRHSDFAELAAFAAIVEEGSFRGAAARLGLRPSTVSHSLRALEEKLGVQLLHRTTRSVAPTEAGQALFARVGPALAGMESAIEAVNAHRDLPAGRIRLSMPRCVASQVLLPRLRAFMERFPDIQLDIAADNGFVDIVRDGFDAGIRLRESIPGDMVAVPVTPDLQTMVVASPDHLTRHPAPPHTPRTAPPPLHRLSSDRQWQHLSMGVHAGRPAHPASRRRRPRIIRCPGPRPHGTEPGLRAGA